MDTLKYIHGPVSISLYFPRFELQLKFFFKDFKLKDASEYENESKNLAKKYWLGYDNLVIKGACDFSKNDEPGYEGDRLKQFALLRLER